MPGNVPFYFENRCSELVMKIAQVGEKQWWLVNPGMSLNYTWDNTQRCQPGVQWMVYGAEEEAVTLHTSPGQVLWGEEKVVHRVVRSRRSQTSSSDTESEDEDLDNSPVKIFSKSSSSSKIQPQNIIYKTKKSVYWITHGEEGTDNYKVFFYTSRKTAARQLSCLLTKTTRNLLVCLHSLSLCLMDQGRQVGSVLLEPPGVQWHLLVHGTWRFLGEEISSLIETALTRGDTSLLLPGILKVDLKQMTSTSPLYAPLKRVRLPAITSMVKVSRDVLTAKLALTRLRLETQSGHAVSVIKPFLHLKRFRSQDINQLDYVDLSSAGVNLNIENIQSLGGIKNLIEVYVKHCNKTLSVRKFRVNPMDVHVLGVDNRLPSIIRDSFKDYENLR